MMILLFGAVLIFSLVNGAWLLRRIQNQHHSVWRELRQPTVTASSGFLPRLALVQYIWSLRFRVLTDRSLSFACWAAMTSEFLLCASFLMIILKI